MTVNEIPEVAVTKVGDIDPPGPWSDEDRLEVGGSYDRRVNAVTNHLEDGLERTETTTTVDVTGLLELVHPDGKVGHAVVYTYSKP